MDKPYAVWHWQNGKPARSYCWLCWSQQKIQGFVSFPQKRNLALFYWKTLSLPQKIFIKACGIDIGKRVVCLTFFVKQSNLGTVTIQNDVQVCQGAKITAENGGSVRLLEGCAIGRHCSILSIGGTVEIGSGTLLSDWINISNAEHIVDGHVSPVLSGLRFKADVKIGKNCLIGKGVTILPGALIGNGCIIGAGAVVTAGNYKDGTILIGVPARSK